MLLRFNKQNSYSILERFVSSTTTNTLVAKSTSRSSELVKSKITEAFKKSPSEKSKQQRKIQSLLAERRLRYDKISLNSYLDVCVDVGQINRAYNALLHYSRSRKQVTDIEHYNIVLKGWAKLNSKLQISETLMHLTRSKLKPNAKTFLYVLLGHSNKSSGTLKTSSVEVRKIIRHMKIRNIDPRNLLQAAYLGPNERKSVTKLLQSLDPNYDDVFHSESFDYECKLANGIKEIEPAPTYNFVGDIDLSKLDSWADHQRTVEWKPSVSIKSVATTKDSPAVLGRYLKIWQKLQEIWRKALLKSLDESLETLQKQCADSNKVHLYPYLCTVDKNVLVNLMLDEIEINAVFSSYSFSTNQLHHMFGTKIMTRYMRAKAIADGSSHEIQKIYNDYLAEYCKNPDLMSRMTPREFIQEKAAETKNYAIYKDISLSAEQWPHHVIAAVGRFFYGLILREVKFDPNLVGGSKRDINPNNLTHAFYTAYFQIDNSHKIKEEFRAHQLFEKLHQKACSGRLKFDYSFLPTSSPPLPWLSHNLGGYLTYKSELVRAPHSSAEHLFSRKQSLEIEKLYPSLDSLNAISLCPWIVNEDVLDIVIKLFKAGGNTDLAIPLDDAKMESAAPVLEDDASKPDRIIYNKEKKKYDRRRMDMYSLWRTCLYRLSIANHLRGRIFWFPHNMDFRGRTYPIPPHFNHLGADLARALLLFAKGQPLGEKGLDWLKIHMINLVGKMKNSSIQDRLEHANSILHSDVLDSADNPWDGKRWWMDNENPWQVLACCKEIAKAIRSKDSKQYMSHFPVHQDGSCNGLQHYAALGRDVEGAKAVNLVPSGTPQDVYSRVVDIVENMRKKDAENGNKIAESLEGYVQRKVIKQTVMTIVYGVTRYGARQQIARQLQAKDFPDHEVWKASQYLATKTFASIGQMFNKSRQIQNWLTDCAHLIASKYRQHVSWETPLGFPVTQPYTMPNFVSGNRILASSFNPNVPIFNDPLSRLNMSKQKNAFPPNYIHSLDSSHMMLTSLQCHRQGVTFVSVHDCYWTHPSTVDLMNKSCRQQFVALHSEPLLQQLSEQFIRNFESERGNSTTDGSESISSNNDNNLDQTKVYDYEDDRLVEEDLQLFLESEYEVALGLQTGKPLIQSLKESEQKSEKKVRTMFRDVPEQGELDLKQVLESTYFFS